MHSRVSLLACLAVLLALQCIHVSAKSEDVLAKIAAAKAAVSPEQLAEMIRTNTVTNADLLPTRPPPKEWTYSGVPESALLITPGRGKGCNLKKFPNLQRFLREEALYYPALKVDYAVAVDPKLKFYATAALRDSAMIHGSELSEEDLLALLSAGPDETKDPLLSVELSDNDPSVDELKDMLKAHGLERSEQPDQEHSSRLIFKPDFVPIED